MTKEEIIYVATKAFEKGWDFETMKYSDDMYVGSEYSDRVWEFVEEMQDIGRTAFYEKYLGCKFY